MSYKNDKFKISAPTWDEEFEWIDRSYSVSDIQDSLNISLKKTGGSYWQSFNNHIRK